MACSLERRADCAVDHEPNAADAFGVGHGRRLLVGRWMAGCAVQPREQLHKSGSVGRRVMHLQYVGRATAVQTVDEYGFPGRA
jgi:hypothetical protein